MAFRRRARSSLRAARQPQDRAAPLDRGTGRRSPGLDTVWLTPSDIPDESRLHDLLLPESFRKQMVPDEVSVPGPLSGTWRPGHKSQPPLGTAIAARALRKPLLLLLDEAQTLERPVGRALLNASQRAGRQVPFSVDARRHPGSP